MRKRKIDTDIYRCSQGDNNFHAIFFGCLLKKSKLFIAAKTSENVSYNISIKAKDREDEDIFRKQRLK
jgi:hypothetical protein